jgi:micrococcal nuclease
MYNYNAKLVRVIDGDTIVLDVDLGFHVTMRETFRLFGVNAPENTGPTRAEGKAARDFVVGWFDRQHGLCMVNTYKGRSRDKYGRYLAEVWPADGVSEAVWPPAHEGRQVILNEALIAAGHAKKDKP